MKIKGTYLPTYEEAVKICTSNDNFYESKHVVDGYNVSTFNYRLSNYDAFNNPIKGSNINAYELRGLTFVHNKGKSVRTLQLQKFWNLNQVESSMYNVVKDYEVVLVNNKIDGSLISFITLPNGNVVSKTQNSFDNEQTEVVNKLYAENEDLQKFVKWTNDMNYSAMFEYVAFTNKIVLNYDEAEVILLKVRDNKTGEYITDFDSMGLKEAEVENYSSLDELVELSTTMVDKEGWVATLKTPDGEYVMVKMKTEWYFLRHKLLTEDLNREDYVVKMVCEEKIDDLISQLDPENDKVKIDWVNGIVDITQKFLITRMKEVEELVNKFEGNIADFAIRYKKDKNFSMAISVVRGKCDVFTAVNSFLINHTKRLEQARSFVKRKGFKRK
jgi:Straboviridae RNA ligase 1